MKAPAPITAARCQAGFAARLRGSEGVFLAEHLDEAADGERVQRVLCLAALESPDPGRYSDAELKDFNLEQPSRSEVSELV